MKTPYDEIRQEYASDGGTIQMLFRVGQPTSGTPLSMRRDVTEIIINK